MRLLVPGHVEVGVLQTWRFEQRATRCSPSGVEQNSFTSYLLAWYFLVSMKAFPQFLNPRFLILNIGILFPLVCSAAPLFSANHLERHRRWSELV